jgi:hypothetical protein
MDSIEKAIRSAFAKGDPSERAFREKVYRSAFGALDRSLKANPNVTEAIAQRRRETLLAAITAIETEFVPARPAPASAAPQRPSQPAPRPQQPAAAPDVVPEAPGRSVPGRGDGAPAPDVAPTLDGERRPVSGGPAARSGKQAAPQAAGAKSSLREGRRERPRRRFRFAGPLAFLLLVGLAGAAAWWLVVSGQGERLLTPPQAGESGGPRIPGSADTFEGWIDIFTAADPTTVTAPGDTQAEVMEEDGARFMRIRSGASGSPVLFDVGQGVLEDIAGRRAVFTIVAQAREGEETQISVDCEFGVLGDCGRKRYVAGAAREEYLFEIDLPSQRPDAGGVIAINPDVEGRGRAVDIHAIRVRPAQ